MPAAQVYTVIYSVNNRGCCGAGLTTHYRNVKALVPAYASS